MKIGIIVHSQTGNTYTVALRLRDRLSAAGHAVNIEKVIPILNGKQADRNNIQLETAPDVSTYDALIFGAPVQGFSLSPVMAAYLGRLGSLNNKKVACLVTQFFPYAWMGGNRAIGQMKDICLSKGGKVCGAGIVNWSGGQREKKIHDVVEGLSSLFYSKDR